MIVWFKKIYTNTSGHEIFTHEALIKEFVQDRG